MKRFRFFSYLLIDHPIIPRYSSPCDASVEEVGEAEEKEEARKERDLRNSNFTRRRNTNRSTTEE